MKTKHFIHPEFMPEGKTAEVLYHDIAEKQSIIDFHTRLFPVRSQEKTGLKMWLSSVK